MDDEKPEQQEKLKMFHPVHTYISKFVTNYEAKELHHVQILMDGDMVYELPGIIEIQQDVKENLLFLWDEYKRLLNPEEYPVDLSQKCWDNKMVNIQQVKEKVEAR